MPAKNPEKIDQNRFNAIVNQVVYAVGADVHTDQLRRHLQTLQFVQFKVAKSVQQIDLNAQFLVIVVDFGNMPAVQSLARFVNAVVGFSGVTVVYAVAPVNLTEQDLLFGVELGVKRTFFGPTRDEDFRSFIKQQAIEVTELGSLAFAEQEVMKAIRRGQEEGLRIQCEKLAGMSKMSEDINRLQALLYEARHDFKRMEFHLKQTLKINPQNLWAANYLGRFYLRNRKVAEGIEILKKLSRFHELNAERMLVLGDAYLNAGRAKEAEATLTKGDVLTGGNDDRIREGLVKVDVLKGDMQAALKKIGKKFLSFPVLAFLNTRAVMASRAKMYDDGVKLYDEAIRGCDPNEKILLAKLWFNSGLAFVRMDRLEDAIQAFTKSVEIGGIAYDRARNPLAKAKQMLAKRSSGKSGGKSDGSTFEIVAVGPTMDEFEFESLRGAS